MRYFMVIDINKKRHIVVAHDINDAKRIASASIQESECYELKPDTFNNPGFLISDK